VGFVATGNATGEVLALVILPLLDWLSIPWLLENPATWALQRSDDDSLFLLILILNSSVLVFTPFP